MNKKLIALAIAAALAPAAAMADSGNVTIYGVLDASIDMTENGNPTVGASGIRANKVSSNNSRLGFKGTEDVGNGLSAIWQIETTAAIDGGTAATTLGSRNTFLGLSSATMGTAILGRHDTPYKLATRGLDYFTDGLADNRNIMGGGAVSAGSVASFDGRQSDVVAYISPTMGGFNAAVAYVAGSEGAITSGQQKGNAWSAMGMYNNGPIIASLAYEQHKFGDVSTGDLNAPIPGTIAGQKEKAWKLGAGYTFGPLAVNGVFEKISDDFAASNDHKDYTLAAKYALGSNDLKLAYTHAGDKDGQSDTGAKQWALGVDHNMSKRTKVYVQYVRLNNDANATYGLNGAAATGSVMEAGRAGADPSALSLGMRHSF